MCRVSGGACSESGRPAADLPPVADASGGGAVGQQGAPRSCQPPRRPAHLRVSARYEEHGGCSAGQLAPR